MDTKNNETRGVLLGVMLAIGVFTASSALMLLLFSAILSALESPEDYVYPLGLLTCYLSSALCGALATARTKSLISALICGAVIVGAQLLLSLTPAVSTPSALSYTLSCILLGITPALGGIIPLAAARKKPKRKKGRRQR